MPTTEFTLNEAQTKVLENTTWPLLVVAGAGTGKTRVIVEKINVLINTGVEPASILALTFTEKAAAEMLDRVLERRSGFELTMPILTFNAYGEQLLREFSVDAGLSSSFQLLGESAKIVFLTQNLESLELDYFSPLSYPEGQIPELAKYFSKLKQYVITPEEYAEFTQTMSTADESDIVEKQKHQELARAYANYITLCRTNNVIDYDDQIYCIVELLKNKPNVRKVLQSRYHTIMVDEFQDTNPMQSELIHLLTTEKSNLMVVGDDDQSIYGFRGATLANILDFKKMYPKASEVTLIENYRSSQQILDSAYRLIQNNNPHRLEATLKIHKQLKAHSQGNEPSVHCFSNITQELEWLKEDIANKLASGISPGEIAILCRRNATARYVSEALSLADIEHVVIGEKYQLYKTPVVRTLIEALKAVADPSASLSLYHTLSGELFAISPTILSVHASSAKKQYEGLEDYLLSTEIDVQEELTNAVILIRQWREHSGALSVGQLAYKILEESGLKDRLYNQALEEADSALTITQLSQFFRTLKEFESIATVASVVQYLESLPVLEAAGQSNEDGTLELSASKVNVLTVHKAKGLEWEITYIPDCTEGSFPMRTMPSGIKVPQLLIEKWESDADEHYAEERRLMYVAATRAKKELVLSYSKKHYTPTPKKPSRFLGELFETIPEESPVENVQQELNFEFLQKPSNTTRTMPLPTTMQYRDTIRLSVSQITTFLNCPLDFYYRFILAVPEPASHAASYGSAVHSALEVFNKAKLNRENLDLESIIAVLHENWKNDGYLSKVHAQKAKKQAEETIRTFFEIHSDDLAPSRVEWPFSLRLEEEKLTISGRLDAVFESESGVEIRDYKTSSSVTTSEKAKRRASSSEQLTLYALVWQELNGELPSQLSLEFVDTGQIGSVRKTARGIDSMRAKLGNVTSSIRNNNYPAGKNHDYCQHPPLD